MYEQKLVMARLIIETKAYGTKSIVRPKNKEKNSNQVLQAPDNYLNIIVFTVSYLLASITTSQPIMLTHYIHGP